MNNARATVFQPKSSAKNGAAPQRRPRLNTTITNLQSQIERKASQGKTLTAVEQHIAKKLSRNTLKPSLGSVLFHAAKQLMLPGSVAALALVGLTLALGRAPHPSEGQLSGEAAAQIEVALIADRALQGEEASAAVSDPGLNAVLDSVKESAKVKLFDFAALQETPPPVAAAEPQTAAANIGIDPEVARKQGLIKFLAGMIAIHHPQIADCGAVARDIVEISGLEKIDPFFVASIISVESRFFTDARSKVGATGLMQLMPSTAKEVAEDKLGRKKIPVLTDPHTNIRLGVHYIKELEQKYRGNRYLALSAYNWGPAKVDKGGRIPASVSKYATTIMERTVRWKKHFSRAEASATALNQAAIAGSKS